MIKDILLDMAANLMGFVLIILAMTVFVVVPVIVVILLVLYASPIGLIIGGIVVLGLIAFVISSVDEMIDF